MTKTKELTLRHPNNIVLVLQGGFYHAVDDAAKVLASIMGYKLRQTNGGEVECGFPYNTLDKVMIKLEYERINYVVYQKDMITNQYEGGAVVLDEYLKDANIPPPIPIARPVSAKSPHSYKPGILKIKCSNTLLQVLKDCAAAEEKDFDRFVVEIIKKGLKS